MRRVRYGSGREPRPGVACRVPGGCVLLIGRIADESVDHRGLDHRDRCDHSWADHDDGPTNVHRRELDIDSDIYPHVDWDLHFDFDRDANDHGHDDSSIMRSRRILARSETQRRDTAGDRLSHVGTRGSARLL